MCVGCNRGWGGRCVCRLYQGMGWEVCVCRLYQGMGWEVCV